MKMANERRLIDLDELTLEYIGLAEISPYDFAGICKYFVDQLENLPTVDAVEVVRCKDCKWYRYGNIFDNEKFCFRLKHPGLDKRVGYNFAPDDFCSYGEKREVE